MTPAFARDLAAMGYNDSPAARAEIDAYHTSDWMDPAPSIPALAYRWLTIDWSKMIGVQALPGDYNMLVVDGNSGDEWLVPGMHREDPIVILGLRRFST